MLLDLNVAQHVCVYTNLQLKLQKHSHKVTFSSVTLTYKRTNDVKTEFGKTETIKLAKYLPV